MSAKDRYSKQGCGKESSSKSMCTTVGNGCRLFLYFVLTVWKLLFLFFPHDIKVSILTRS